MRRRIQNLFIVTVFLIANSFVQAQSALELIADSVLHAYPDKPAFRKNWTQQIYFEKNNETKSVSVKVYNQIDLVSMTSSSYYDENVFTDQFTSLLDFTGVSSTYMITPGSLYCTNAYSDFAFYDDNKVCTQRLTLNYFGQIWGYKYTLNYLDSRYFTLLDFQDELPIMEKKMVVNLPPDVDVEIAEMNFEGFDITRTENITPAQHQIIYKAKNIPPSKSYNYSPGYYRTTPYVLFYVKSAVFNGEKKKLLTDASDLYNWYHSLIVSLKPSADSIKNIVTPLIKDCKTDLDKMRVIYSWVQDNIRYIAFEYGLAGFKPEEAMNVYRYRYGDCKGMANLLCEMLKAAGIDARRTWIGTRDIPFTYSNTPSLCVDNHMICTVFLNGKKYYLDGTESAVSLGENAERIQGKQVMIEDGMNYIIDTVPNVKAEENLKFITVDCSIDNNIISGSLKCKMRGEMKRNYFYESQMDSEKEILKMLKAGVEPDLPSVLTNFTYVGLSEKGKDLEINSSFSTEFSVNKIGDKLFLDLNLFKKYKDMTIADDRFVDVDLGEKKKYVYMTNFKIPAGRTVEFLPDPWSYSSDDFTIVWSVKSEAGVVKNTLEIEIKNGYIHKKNFSLWNEAIRKMNEKFISPVIIR